MNIDTATLHIRSVVQEHLPVAQALRLLGDTKWLDKQVESYLEALSPHSEPEALETASLAFTEALVLDLRDLDRNPTERSPASP